VFDAMNMKQYVHGPTRENRRLDGLAYSDEQLIRDVIVDDAGNVSDHRLVMAQLRVDSKHWSPVTYKFCLLKHTDCNVFEQSLQSSPLFTAPENAIEALAEQLRTVVVSTLDRLAPLRTVKRTRSDKHINRFLSEEAIVAKQKRRRLERDWKKSSAEPDRLAYREQYRLANRLINESCIKHYAEWIIDIPAGSKNVGLL
jgi:hypothetical protein